MHRYQDDLSAGAQAVTPILENSADVVTLLFHGGVARLTLNRPEHGNAIDQNLARALRDKVGELSVNPDVGAVLLTGAGRRFCVGGDLKAFAAEGENASAYVRELIADFSAALLGLTQLPVPVIAAVQSAAAGAGVGLALAADIVLAADDAKFVMAYTNAGVTPDGGTSWILPRLVGLQRALDLTLRNQPLTAAEAHALGLVAELCAPSDLLRRAAAVAAQLSDGPTGAYAEAKRLLRSATLHSLPSQLEAEGQSVVAAFATPDGQEGARAFTERRAPDFRRPTTSSAPRRAR